MLDITYPPVIVTAKVLFKLMRQRVVVSGAESIPRKGGALLAINHTGYIDFIYAGAGAEPRGRLVRFMIKKEMMDKPGVGHLLRSFHHIRVDRSSGVQAMKDALAYLRAGEVVGIYPEATISRSPKTILVRVGEPLHPTGEDVEAETAELRAAMQRMLDEAIADYPEEEKAPGSWWIPARFGGSAPTPEEADRLDRAELRERAARRAARAAEKKQG